MVSSHEFSILKRNSRDYNFVKAKTEKTQENLVEVLIQFLPKTNVKYFNISCCYSNQKPYQHISYA